MRGPVLLALLGLCVPLAAGWQGAVVKDFDLDKFAGFWYEIAYASKIQDPKARKVVAVQVEWEGGHLALTTAYEDETGCVKDKRLAMKGDVPGRFKLPKEFGDKEIWVLSTDYEAYAILDVQIHHGAASSGALKLYSRTLEHDKDVLKKFHQAAADYGLSPKEVHLNTWDLTCANMLRTGAVPSS